MMLKFARNRLQILLLLVLAAAVACDDDDSSTAPVVVDEAQLLVDHLEVTTDPHAGFIMSAQALHTNLLVEPDDYLVIDMRAASDYAAGHIEGAVNVGAGGLADYLAGIDAASYENVVLVCYSGQTAAFAAGALRAAGYDNVVSMKWGMSGWNPAFAVTPGKFWAAAPSNQRVTQFVTTASPAKNAAGELPVLNTGFDTPEQILEARVAQVFADGFGAAKITDDDVFLNLDDYYVINYWPQSLYMEVGHIPGAINYDPSTQPWLQANDLTTLPTDKPIVIYCYTGQGSAFLSGYLRVLGYDVRSLLYGANSMVWDRMKAAGVGSAFDASAHVEEFDYVTGA